MLLTLSTKARDNARGIRTIEEEEFQLKTKESRYDYLLEGWSKSEKPVYKANYYNHTTDDQHNKRARIAELFDKFVKSDDLCWSREFKRGVEGETGTLFPAETECTYMQQVARGYDIKVSRRGNTVYLERY
jgi:hypothetical protein